MQSMVVHKSRLERDKEAAVAAAARERGAAGARGGDVPGYMRATSAFASKTQAQARPCAAGPRARRRRGSAFRPVVLRRSRPGVCEVLVTLLREGQLVVTCWKRPAAYMRAPRNLTYCQPSYNTSTPATRCTLPRRSRASRR